jgi:hypothetical protein
MLLAPEEKVFSPLLHTVHVRIGTFHQAFKEVATKEDNVNLGQVMVFIQKG